MDDILKYESANMNCKALLEVQALSCGYGKKEVIKDISFSVKEGSFLGVLGPNGAGKTTLFRALTKIIKPIQGAIFYKGEDIIGISVRQMAKEVAVLPQVLDIPFSFSVEEFVFLGRYSHLEGIKKPDKNDEAVLEKVMDETGVIDLRHRKINQLSIGERQRVIFAQALAQEPRLILLDEPVNHLDIRYQIEFMDLLRDLNINGLSVVIILHDLNLAAEYCKNLLLLNKGKIKVQGKPEEVLDYKIIEEVYNTLVVVEKNPISGKPYVLLVSKNSKKGA